MSDPLAHYLSAWELRDPQLLARTHTSLVYTVTRASETLVLKLLSENGREEQRGAVALLSFDGRGAVRLYQSSADAQLLEYAAGDHLISLVERGDDAGATRIIASVLTQLHGASPEPARAGLCPLKDWFRELFEKAESDRAAGVESLYVRGADLAARLLADPLDIRVLHGDIHHRNVRHSSRGWLAFDPKGLFGERTYDAANALCNPVRKQHRSDPLVHDERRLLTNAGILADALGVERTRLLQFTFAYACLSASWSLTIHDDDAAQWALEIGRLLEPYVSKNHLPSDASGAILRPSMSAQSPKVDEFVSRAKAWRGEMHKLRSILLECGLEEDLKWGKPCFMFEGKNIAIIQPFKAHCSLLFFKGALFQDTHGLLREQGQNTQSALRLEFTSEAEIKKAMLRSYVKQAISVEKAGLEVDFKAKRELELPRELTQILQKDPKLAKAFHALTPGRQRGYALHFTSAKQSRTRAARIEKCIPQILAGKGMHDR